MDIDFGLLVYIILWGCTFLYSIKRCNNQWNVSTFIIATYFAFSLMAGVLYTCYPAENYKYELSFLPFIYLFLMLLLGLAPVTCYANREYVSIYHPSKFIINGLILFYVLLAIINIPSILENIQTGLFLLLTDDDGGLDLYREARDSNMGADGAVSNILSVFYNFLSPICIFLFFYYLTLEKKNKLVLIMLILSLVVRVLDSVAHGQRTGPTMIAFTFLATFFMFRPFLTKKMKRGLIFTMGIGGLALLIPFMALTNSRFQNREGGSLEGIVYYVGQAPLYFNDCMDAGGIRYGDRTAPEFKRLLGYNNVPTDENDRRAKYSSLKIDAYSFYTYVGDFVLDYGPFGAFLIFVFFSSAFIGMTKHRKRSSIPFHKLLLVYFAASVCVQGGMYLFNFAHYGNYSIIVIFLLYLVFWADYQFRKIITKPVVKAYE